MDLLLEEAIEQASKSRLENILMEICGEEIGLLAMFMADNLLLVGTRKVKDLSAEEISEEEESLCHMRSLSCHVWLLLVVRNIYLAVCRKLKMSRTITFSEPISLLVAEENFGITFFPHQHIKAVVLMTCWGGLPCMAGALCIL